MATAHDLFARIDHLDEVAAAIAGREEFFVRRNPELGIAAVSYSFLMPDSFPDPREPGIDAAEKRRRQILRECRGLTFDLRTGEPLLRKLHKFFNVNEKPETQAGAIDWSRPHHVLLKEDGSLLTPVVLPSGQRWTSKIGVTEVSLPVERYAADRPGYARLAAEAAASGFTPVFEWCSRIQRIVLDYPEDALVMLAARDLRTGRYWLRGELEDLARDFGVPLVEIFADGVGDAAGFLSGIDAMTGIEGVVVAFDDGDRYKVKTEEYRRRHRAVSGLVQEKDVVAMILSGQADDLRPALAPEILARLDDFEREVQHGLTETARSLVKAFRADHAAVGGDRKRFALERGAVHGEDVGHIYALWAQASSDDETLTAAARESVVRQALKRTGSSTELEKARRLWGGTARWTLAVRLDD